MIRLILFIALAVLVGRMVWTLLRRVGQIPPPHPEHVRTRWDPHGVLGVSRNASPEAITEAYREQMKLYHPDRVATLGPELQRVAHDKTIEIQRAYEELSRR